MRYDPLPKELYIRNRAKLVRLMQPGSLAVVLANDPMPTSADGTFPLHPDPDLFYLTGIEQEETILLLAPDAPDPKLREVLFLRKSNPELETWEGHKLTPEEARALSGVQTIRWLEEFETVFHQLMCVTEHVYLNLNEHRRAKIQVETRQRRFVRWCQERYPLHHYVRLAPLMHRLRVRKEPEELEQVRRACVITKAGFLQALRKIRPGIREMEIEAEYAYQFVRAGARFAYPPIIASGPRACVLHYTKNDEVCQDGELVLLDVGAAYGNYNADLTRTVPVNGRFTPRQREVYEAVLRVQRAMIRATVVGKTYREWQREAEALIAEELVRLGLLRPEEAKDLESESRPLRRYFMHGVGHPLGLDVHDVGFLEEPFAPGWILTVEPGIYIREEGIGVRLENDVLVTENGPVDLMADIPIEPEEIEEWMATNREG